MESQLHDPSTYGTYPARWHALLQHLALSHSLIVLHLRSLEGSAFPNPAPLPFEDDNLAVKLQLPVSASLASLSSAGIPRSRMSSTAGSDAGSIAPSSKMPRQERIVEIIMPEPLATQSEKLPSPQLSSSGGRRQRGSISSIASISALAFNRRRSNSLATNANSSVDMPGSATSQVSQTAVPIISGKAALPPVSYPSPKRYGFARHGDQPALSRSRQASVSGRPGSMFSLQSSPSISHTQRAGSSSGNQSSTGV